MIDVDVVEPDGGMLDPDLAFTRRAELDLFPFQDLRSAVLVNANSMRH